MAKILARKGHNVTIFTSDIKGEKIVNENITDVMLLLSVEQVLAERKIYTWSNFIAKFIEPLGWYTDMCKASVNIHR